MDNPPSVLMRLLQLGDTKSALTSEALWWCLGCQTCSARCPQNVEIAGSIDTLREIAIKEKLYPTVKIQKLVEAFHESFLKTVRKYGRLNEVQLVNYFKLKTGKFLQDMDNGILMMIQGKINPINAVIPKEKVKGIEQIREIFELSEEGIKFEPKEKLKPIKKILEERNPIEIDPTKPIGYYPGCSLNGTGKEFNISTRKLCELLGLDLRELSDWNCCGASSAHSTNHTLSLLLPARTHLLAEAEGYEYVLTPCAACLNRQMAVHTELIRSAILRDTIKQIVGVEFQNKTRFINVMQLIMGLPEDYLKSRVVTPLTGRKFACYYGCLLVRPITAMGFDDTEYPMKMDRIVEAIGAETVDWDFKTECCGAGLTMASPELIEELIHKILKNAHQAGAEGIVVSCPLCHTNLDMRQKSMRKRFKDLPEIPIYYLTELIAFTCGAEPKQIGLKTHFVPTNL